MGSSSHRRLVKAPGHEVIGYNLVTPSINNGMLCTHENRHNEVVLTSTHSIHFYVILRKIS